ncbi:TauD/TfdA family dioxygenase [Allokutzneria sp. A3M-2-11 16]|uniref:TauD/TfdA dioxygenase family protein n=1 Tax=Allokutzneria sp. A3M-2-11 16 TaxID=2962043 RepID=UPI0020B85672|nr:TauD/TfdA family dioxygenase [Allokutzneria sp. A3M-2-11 16]MCP3804862.1 TauD/TfdA family dioxygenase [Allokutzneria sp. A3M-2-11 16]
MTSTSLDPTTLRRTPLTPFGLLVEASDGLALTDLPPEVLARWTEEARVLVLRGFPLLDTEGFAAYCHRWGEVLRWDFGEVFDLVQHENPKNYLFARGDVPFHWDGVFAKNTPGYFMFQCLEASPGAGGETVFSDTTRVYRDAPPELRAHWSQISVRYATDKLAHYGGDVTEPLVAVHPRSGMPTVRYAEPLDPESFLNPLFLEVDGVPEAEVPALLEDLAQRLHQPRYCYPHEWRTGDVVIADNHALVHGRNAFTGESVRHLQRVQVI